MKPSNLTSNAGSQCSDRKTEVVQISSACCFNFLDCSLSLSLSLSLSARQWVHAHRHSERTCTREGLSDGRTSGSSSISLMEVKVLPTESEQKNFLSPRRYMYVPETTMASPSAAHVAPMKATDQAFETGSRISWRAVYRREQLWN